MRSTLIACAVAIVLGVSAVMAQSPIREGRWEITVQMQIPNMPTGMPPQKIVQCITKGHLADPGKALPGGPDPNDKNALCKVSDYKTSGNKITWNLACSGPNAMSGSGEIVVDGDSYKGAMNMKSDKGDMAMKYSAKRLGDCTE